MPFIHPRGTPTSRIWIVFRRPLSTDADKKYMMSGGLGYAFQKMLEEAGISMNDCFVSAQFPDTDTPLGYVNPGIEHHQPPLIIAIGEAGAMYLNELRPQGKQTSYKTQLNKYVGSLLKGHSFGWNHWIMPLFDPQDLMADWTERNVTTYIDLAKVKDELEHWKKTGTVQPLRSRTLLSSEMEDDELFFHLDNLRTAPFRAEDIETVYPRKGSAYYKKHPGIPVTFGIATSPEWGISFSLFRKSPAATREAFKKFDKLHSNDAIIIGQNFFNFDSLFYNMMGFHCPRDRFQDTLIRQHILWPELPKSLQFLTRQYTRQPYYKDEGKHWKLTQLDDLRHYNCLDVTVDFEVFEAQEEEFKQRPHLKEAS